MADKTIPEHPLVSKLVAGSANAMCLRGYVGPSSEGHVRLYPGLDDLSESVEIARADIVHTAEAADSSPPGATSIWVKRDAEVTYYRIETVRTPAQALPRRFTQAETLPASELVEVNRGRLKILVRGGGLRADDVCQSRCQVCTSRCQVCQSRCGVCHSGFGRFGGIAGNPGFFGNLGNIANLGRLRNGR